MKDRVIQVSLYDVILTCITLLMIFFAFRSCEPTPLNTKYVDQKRSIDSLNYVILELKTIQIILDDKILNSGNKIDSLSQEIVNTKTEILNTKNYYDKKIRDARTYTPTQLDKFFADRYKQVIYKL